MKIIEIVDLLDGELKYKKSELLYKQENMSYRGEEMLRLEYEIEAYEKTVKMLKAITTLGDDIATDDIINLFNEVVLQVDEEVAEGE